MRQIKFMIFHNHQKVILTHDTPCLVINNTVVDSATELNFSELPNIFELEFHSSKIANKIYRTLGTMN